MKQIVMKLVKIKLQFVRKLQVYKERELFGLELSVFESVPVKMFQFEDLENQNRNNINILLDF
jgi:hypothetical protein